MDHPAARLSQHGNPVYRIAPLKSLGDSQNKQRYSRSMTGCKRCKKMHLKCTEEKPACNRCHRASVKCEYSPLKMMVFDPRSQQNRQPRQDIFKLEEQRSPKPSVYLSLPPDILNLAGSLFLDNNPELDRRYGLNGQQLVCSLIPSLRGIPQTSAAQQCMRSYAALALSISRQDAALHLHSLQAKQVALKDLRAAMQNNMAPVEVVLSIMLMICWEVLDREGPDAALVRILRHLDAVQSIICAMPVEVLHDVRHEYLFDSVIEVIAWAKAAAGKRVPFPEEAAAFNFDLPLGRPRSALREIGRLAARTSYLRERAVALHCARAETNHPDAMEKNLRLFQDVQELCVEFDCQALKMPAPHVYHTGPDYVVDQEDIESADVWPGEIYLFSAIADADSFLLFQSICIWIFHVAINCANFAMQHCTDGDAIAPWKAEFVRYSERMRRTVDCITAAVPFLLKVEWDGSTRGLEHLKDIKIPRDMEGPVILTLEIHMASCLEVVPAQQRKWLKSRNRLIGRCYGIPSATLYATKEFPGLLFGKPEGDDFEASQGILWLLG